MQICAPCFPPFYTLFFPIVTNREYMYNGEIKDANYFARTVFLLLTIQSNSKVHRIFDVFQNTINENVAIF